VASVCSQTVSINLSTTASAGNAPSAQCPEVGGNDFSLSGSFTNGTALWTVKAGSATGTAVGSVKSDGTTATPVVHVDGVGSVTFILTVTSNQTPSCVASTSEVTVTVNSTPVEPDVTYTAPTCNENTFSITITNVVSGATYTITDKNGDDIVGITGLTAAPSTYIAPNANDATFGNIPAGSGYQVSVSVNGCSDTNICPPLTKQASKTVETVAPIEAKTETAGFTTYPVPFKDQLTIKYNFDYISDVKIEVFDSQGISVLSKADTNGYLNKEVTLDLKLNRGRDQVYVVKVTTNRGSSIKKVISSR
jgi:hypothetical protein